MSKQRLSILGSTGSIGVSTLDLCRTHPDRFEVVALCAGRNLTKLKEQIAEFSPKLVSVSSEEDAQTLRGQIEASTQVLSGDEGAVAVATLPECDLVVSAIVGAAGLLPTLKAIEAGKPLALANKESMIIAGEILSEAARKSGVPIIPVDSEHSAIFQCLNGEHREDISKLILTASGGPFFKKPKEEFASITREQALKHPNWDMGAKITIDSATMMNKGLEVIEAHYLFDLPVSKIDVVVHPQSIVHSMVEFVDSSVMAQMGEPDMRVPIAYALSYPRRIPTDVKKLDLPEHEKLDFFPPDLEKFPCLKLAFDVAASGGSHVAVLNAANEVAVDAFLNDRVAFVEIPQIVDHCLQNHERFVIKVLEDVSTADRSARETALSFIESLTKTR